MNNLTKRLLHQLKLKLIELFTIDKMSMKLAQFK